MSGRTRPRRGPAPARIAVRHDTTGFAGRGAGANVRPPAFGVVPVTAEWTGRALHGRHAAPSPSIRNPISAFFEFPAPRLAAVPLFICVQ